MHTKLDVQPSPQTGMVVLSRKLSDGFVLYNIAGAHGGAQDHR